MEISNLWSRANYLAPYPCITNTYIIEYDISKANINILLFYGVIDQKTYDMLYNADKKYREIYVGKMEQNNPKITEIKAKGIEEFRHKFFETNQLENKDILSIKNDAIFVIGKDCQYTQFDNITFKKANVYTSYMKLGTLEVYYGYDPISGNELIDVKGINDLKLELHREYMISHLCEVFYALQTSSVQEAIKINSELLDRMLNKCLAKGFYRTFDSNSIYVINTGFSMFQLNDISDDEIKYVNPSANINRLREVSSALSTLYFSHL